MIPSSYAEMLADFVVENRLAVVWSQRIDGDDPEAGKKGRSGWSTADPWPRGNRQGLVAQLGAYDGKRNLLVVTRESKVITVDCDTQAGLDFYRSLNLPNTVTISTGRDGGGFHFVLRPPHEDLKFSFFELAGEDEGAVTGAASTKLHVLAGIHKTGRRYRIMQEAGLEIAEMPADVYNRLAEGYGSRVRSVNQAVSYGKLVPESGRHDYLMGWALAYRKLERRGELLAALLRAERDYACEPGERRIEDSEIKRMAEWADSE